MGNACLLQAVDIVSYRFSKRGDGFRLAYTNCINGQVPPSLQWPPALYGK